jgi:hypothetical protein
VLVSCSETGAGNGAAPFESPIPSNAPSGQCVTAKSATEFCDETAEGGFDLASTYETWRQTCLISGVRDVAKEFDTRVNPAAAAQGVADDFKPADARRHAAYEGCLDGFGS